MNEHLHGNSTIWFSMFVVETIPVAEYVATMHPWGKTSDTPGITGIPPDVMILAEIKEFKTYLLNCKLLWIQISSLKYNGQWIRCPTNFSIHETSFDLWRHLSMHGVLLVEGKCVKQNMTKVICQKCTYRGKNWVEICSPMQVNGCVPPETNNMMYNVLQKKEFMGTELFWFLAKLRMKCVS